MAENPASFTDWLTNAHVCAERLTPAQRHLLEAAFQFRQHQGTDYYSTRLLSHWLLHCHSGLKVALIARLLGLSRSAASAQQGLSSKEVIQAAHHRLAGRAHGKLLPRFAGPIAQFILTHADATRYDVLDFIQHTWGVRVSTVALHHFNKKFGLDRASRAAAMAPRPKAERIPAEPRSVETVPPNQPVPLPPPPFSRRGRNMRARSC